MPDESIFRHQFLAALRGEADVNGDAYVTGTELGEFLQSKVVNYSKGAQHPQYGKIRNPNLDKGDFVFKIAMTIHAPGNAARVEVTTSPAGTMPPSRQSSGPDPEAEMWTLVKESSYTKDVTAFLEAYPSGRFAPAARLKLAQLQRRHDQTGQQREAQQQREEEQRQRDAEAQRRREEAQRQPTQAQQENKKTEVRQTQQVARLEPQTKLRAREAVDVPRSIVEEIPQGERRLIQDVH